MYLFYVDLNCWDQRGDSVHLCSMILADKDSEREREGKRVQNYKGNSEIKVNKH